MRDFRAIAPGMPLDQADGLRRLFAGRGRHVLALAANPHVPFGGLVLDRVAAALAARGRAGAGGRRRRQRAAAARAGAAWTWRPASNAWHRAWPTCRRAACRWPTWTPAARPAPSSTRCSRPRPHAEVRAAARRGLGPGAPVQAPRGAAAADGRRPPGEHQARLRQLQAAGAPLRPDELRPAAGGVAAVAARRRHRRQPGQLRRHLPGCRAARLGADRPRRRRRRSPRRRAGAPARGPNSKSTICRAPAPGAMAGARPAQPPTRPRTDPHSDRGRHHVHRQGTTRRRRAAQAVQPAGAAPRAPDDRQAAGQRRARRPDPGRHDRPERRADAASTPRRACSSRPSPPSASAAPCSTSCAATTG